jgi:hypothetical protein
MVLSIEPMSINNLLDSRFVHRVYLDVDMRVKSKGVTFVHHIIILSRRPVHFPSGLLVGRTLDDTAVRGVPGVRVVRLGSVLNRERFAVCLTWFITQSEIVGLVGPLRGLIVDVRRYGRIHDLYMLKQIASNYIVGTVMSHLSYATITQVPIVRDNGPWPRWAHVVPVAPTPHQSYGLQVLGIVLIGILVLGNKPAELRIVLENEAAKFGRHVGKPSVVVTIT